MTDKTVMALDPVALSAFASTLTNLPKDEISKAKMLYILNAIADFDAQRRSGKAMVITMGIMSIIPIFLIVFIPRVGWVSERHGGMAAEDPQFRSSLERRLGFQLRGSVEPSAKMIVPNDGGQRPPVG